MLRTAILTTALGILVAAPALAADFVLDKAHTQAEFTVTHLVLTKVHGTIPLISGEMDVGPNNLPLNATATFDVTALDTHIAPRDNDLRNNYFEVDKYPTMTFVERKVEGTPAAFTMTGDLTVHGVTKSIVLKGQVLGTQVEKGKKHVAYTAATSFDRRDFGMTLIKLVDNQMIAGFPVDIEIEADAGEK